MTCRVAIRADASTRIGTGHVRRMRSLASALRSRGAAVRFFCRALGVDSARIAGDFAAVALAAPSGSHDPVPGAPPHAAWAEVDQMDDAAEFAAAAAPFAPDWVIVDHYAFDARWHHAVRTALSARIAAIDDVADRPLAADILVDHNLCDDHRLKYAGRLDRDPVLLGGPAYALLDPAFADAPRYRFRDTAERIGLFLGGADPGDATSAVLAAVREGGFAGTIGVVTSSANPNLAALRDRIAGDPGATLAVDLPDLTAFFAGHDIQIGAGGGATWERLCIGAPSVLLALADNQHEVLVPLATRGVATVLPPHWQAGDVSRAIGDLAGAREERRTMSERARALVDGCGASRVADALLGGGAA